LPLLIPSINDIKQNQAYPATADSNKLNTHKSSDALQQASQDKSLQAPPVKPASK